MRGQGPGWHAWLTELGYNPEACVWEVMSSDAAVCLTLSKHIEVRGAGWIWVPGAVRMPPAIVIGDGLAVHASTVALACPHSAGMLHTPCRTVPTLVPEC